MATGHIYSNLQVRREEGGWVGRRVSQAQATKAQSAWVTSPSAVDDGQARYQLSHPSPWVQDSMYSI